MFEQILNGNEIIGAYNFRLVLVSYFIAAFASYTALDLAMRIGESHGKQKRFWIGGCAFAMGGGIWAMHFTGMLASAFLTNKKIRFSNPLNACILILKILRVRGLD